MISGNYYKVKWVRRNELTEVIVKVSHTLPEKSGVLTASAKIVMGEYKGISMFFDHARIIEKFGQLSNFRKNYPEYFI